MLRFGNMLLPGGGGGGGGGGTYVLLAAVNERMQRILFFATVGGSMAFCVCWCNLPVTGGRGFSLLATPATVTTACDRLPLLLLDRRWIRRH